MKTLYDPTTAAEVKSRLAALTPEIPHLWGKMTAPQAVAHCCAALQVPLGDATPPRAFIGRILGPIFRPVFSNEKEFGKNSPTNPTFIVTGDCDLDCERTRLDGLIDRFVAMGPAGCSQHPHSFFGKITATEWGTGMYKHLDHHLRQFGV
jgi:hypothetical protein